MEYYNDGEIIIRDLEERDITGIVEGELAQGWNSARDKYEMRLRDSREGRSVAFAAEYRGEIAGYINLYKSASGAFSGKGIPEIVDFGVLEKFRRRGIGSRLMDVAEQAAGEYADTVCLGVGLHSGYGSAQRMYVKRGYIFDGSGVWYGDSVCGQYADCRNDDDLVLYMSKELKALRSLRSREQKCREHYARLEITADNPENLHEITLTYIKALSGSGAWDFKITSPDGGTNVVIFRFNGGVAAVDAVSKLPHFGCEYRVKADWKYEPDIN